MATFFYTVIDEKGEKRLGNVDAKTEDEAVELLQNQGLTIVSIRKGATGVPTRDRAAPSKEKSIIRYHRGVRADDLLHFSQQLATLLDAGVPLLKSLEILISQVTSKALLEVLVTIRMDVVSGMALHAALMKHPKVFSGLWIDLVRMGESSGNLPGVLNQIARYTQEKQDLNRKVITACVYPVILIFVAIGAISIFVIRVVPIFGGLFKEFGGQLPLLTRIVIGISYLARHSFIYILIALIVVIFLIYRYRKTDTGRLHTDTLLLKLPLVGDLIHQLAIHRFTSGLATLLNSGVSLLHALDIGGGVSGNRLFEIEITKIRDNVKAGKSMAEEIEKTSLFPPTVANMVKVGEESGRLSDMLARVSKYYEDRVSTSLSRLTIALEPILLIFMGGVIGTMVVSMFLPIFQLASIAK